ncbi:MAG TPA: PEP-utilizing enzyme [Candidatus Nanoarchaeia archaeon]|nr:PEP-utilizing enzyme [Candidatus Nanoarchaeia archaeon]
MTHIEAWETEEFPLSIAEICVYADTKLLPQITNFSYTADRYVSRNQRTKRFISIEDIEKAREVGYRNYREKSFLVNLLSNSEKAIHELGLLSEKLKGDHSGKSNKELLALYTDFFETFSLVVAYYHALRPEMIKSFEDDLYGCLKAITQDNLPEIQSALLSGEYTREHLLANFHLTEIPDTALESSAIILGLGRRRYDMHTSWMKALQCKKPLFEEIGKRIGLTPIGVDNCLKEEISQALAPFHPDSIARRLNQFQYQIENGRGVLYHDITHKEEEIQNTKEFKGLCAHPGKVCGIVKIIRRQLTGTVVEDMEQMTQGTVLVSGNTYPDMMLAIHKASAIITDEGGMLSHAAIVSREFKIPCVVGTNIATRILKDGDLVEVDAQKGIVKLLKP